jgi:phenylacetate-CoA ligase
MMFDPEVEALPWPQQQDADEAQYCNQIGYLFERSIFYREKLSAAGFRSPESVGGLSDISRLPLTDKDELRTTRSESNPVGTHLAAALSDIVRIFSTSGTTGLPSYVPLTARDLTNWVRTACRSYTATGIRKAFRVVSTYNAGPFVAGAVLDAFNSIGLCHIPVGTGNTERLLTAIQLWKPNALVLTPSYALHLAEVASRRGMNLHNYGLENLILGGEPGAGEPLLRERLQSAWNARVVETMGIGDISISLWGECEHQNGMHFCARNFAHFELIDPDKGTPVPIEDGATGELVLTHLQHRGAPLLRFRTRDHIKLMTQPCRCGRTAPRIRCIGRTDDMLIVRGVNVFPSAIREVIGRQGLSVTGVISIRPQVAGFKQPAPLRVVVELQKAVGADQRLAETMEADIRAALLVSTKIELVPFGSLPRSEYKSKLVDYSEAKP